MDHITNKRCAEFVRRPTACIAYGRKGRRNLLGQLKLHVQLGDLLEQLSLIGLSHLLILSLYGQIKPIVTNL